MLVFCFDMGADAVSFLYIDARGERGTSAVVLWEKPRRARVRKRKPSSGMVNANDKPHNSGSEPENALGYEAP
jgi:hypothetical protein